MQINIEKAKFIPFKIKQKKNILHGIIIGNDQCFFHEIKVNQIEENIIYDVRPKETELKMLSTQFE
jgi:hypothetical protein